MIITIENTEKIKNLLKDIFTDSFMKENTNFESFEYFKYSSAVLANWEAPRMVYDEDLLNMFVKESTRFGTFDEMVKTAADMKFKKDRSGEDR